MPPLGARTFSSRLESRPSTGAAALIVPGPKRLPKMTCQELSELREGHVLRDETLTATGKAFRRRVGNDAAARGYRFDVAPAAALLARRLNGHC